MDGLNFEFATATRIIFGAGRLGGIGPLAAEMGWRALVSTGPDLNRSQPLLENLAGAGVVPTLYLVSGEPTVESVQGGIHLARSAECDMVIAFGGGSAIDTGKAIAAMLTNPGELLDYLEVVGRGQALSQPAAPFIAIPTTAGAGSEVTRNAVLGVPEHRFKVSMRSPFMLPHLALIDPELTYSLPAEVTASTGMDALAQVIEPFLSSRSNPLTDAICREGMQRVARSLRRACEQAYDPSAREDLSFAALCGGLALANAGLGAVHGFAAPLGGMFPAPHGAVCARLLPFVMEVNLHALHEQQPGHPALGRFDEVAQLLTGQPDARAADGVAWLAELATALHILPLSAYGIRQADIPSVVEKAALASSMKANPVKLSAAELTAILERAI